VLLVPQKFAASSSFWVCLHLIEEQAVKVKFRLASCGGRGYHHSTSRAARSWCGLRRGLECQTQVLTLVEPVGSQPVGGMPT
jgi:hypothetical protein